MLLNCLNVLIILVHIFFGIHLKVSIPIINKENVVINETSKFATLEIPAISLTHDLYEIGDERNDLDKRLIFLNSSSTPEEKKGNVIIAGHSGFGDIAYFRNLYKLKLGNKIYLTYQGKKYTYIIVDMYKVVKTGKVSVKRDSNKKTITLITCYGTSEQLIVIGEQKSNT